MHNDELLVVQFFVYEFSYSDLMKMCFSFNAPGQFEQSHLHIQDYLDKFLLCGHTNYRIEG